MPETIRTVLARALDALDALQLLGEDIEDEWTYVQDLGGAWRDRLAAAVERRGDDPLDEDRVAAVDRAIEEVGRIADPHRAIDWLSTYPQVVLAALERQP